MKEIRLYGTNDYPPSTENNWINLTRTYPEEFERYHLVNLSSNPLTQVMIRYLRLDMIGHTDNKLYCTLTSIRVYGKGMHQILKENLRKINEVEVTGAAATQPLQEDKGRNKREVVRNGPSGVRSPGSYGAQGNAAGVGVDKEQ